MHEACLGHRGTHKDVDIPTKLVCLSSCSLAFNLYWLWLAVVENRAFQRLLHKKSVKRSNLIRVSGSGKLTYCKHDQQNCKQSELSDAPCLECGFSATERQQSLKFAVERCSSADAVRIVQPLGKKCLVPSNEDETIGQLLIDRTPSVKTHPISFKTLENFERFDFGREV